MFAKILVDLTSRQISALFFLGIAFIIGIICSIIVLKKDPTYKANQFTSASFITLSLASLTNVLYTLNTSDEQLLDLTHRITIALVFIGVMLVYIASEFIIRGYGAIGKTKTLQIIFITVVVVLIDLLLPGVTIYLNDPTIGIEQFVEWSLLYFVLAAIPVYLLIAAAIYHYYKLLKGVPEDSNITRAIIYIISGLIVLTVGHFGLVVPHILLDTFEIGTLTLIGNIGNIGILTGFILVFLGYNTKISENQ